MIKSNYHFKYNKKSVFLKEIILCNVFSVSCKLLIINQSSDKNIGIGDEFV